VKTSPHTVESDLYDRSALRRLRGESAAWRRLEEEGARIVPHFAALLDDLFCALFKYNLVRIAVDDAVPSTVLNRTIVDRVVEGPAYAALRSQTLLDEARAGLGTVLIGEGVLRALREDRVLTSGDLLDLWSLVHDEQRAEETEEEAATGEELAKAAHPAEGTKRGRPSRSEAAIRDAAKSARLAARGAAGQREQKHRHVRDALARVESRLEKRVTGAAAIAATRVGDLTDAVHAWGQGVGSGGRQSAGQAIDLGRRLVSNPKLKKLAGLAGRMRERAMALRRRVLDRADEEIYQVGPARNLDDLSRMVPHELLALSHPLLRRDFFRRLLDGGLLTYALRGSGERGRGPLVVCLDTSSSMAGDKEIWAKAVTLTFLEIARRQRRRCHAICFSSGAAELREFDLNPRAPYQVALERTLDLAEYFPGGGTDFMVPLDLALRILRTQPMKQGDVVLITDGECQVSDEWRELFLRAKKKSGFSLYSVLIDVGPTQMETVQALSDRISTIRDLTADNGELFVDLRRKRRAA
jgi:uncharacterized protein with von Willebrand factor type A (vWA) domain